MLRRLRLNALLAATTIATTVLMSCSGGGPPPPDKPDNDTMVAAIRECLNLAANRTLEAGSQPDGFYRNDVMRIDVPSVYIEVDKLLRGAGYGKLADDFILAVNRTAEKSSIEAQAVFENAIAALTIQSGEPIVEGGPTAATDYLRKYKSDALFQGLEPIVKEHLMETGVDRTYKQLGDAWRTTIPQPLPAAVDLEVYIADRMLHNVLAQMAREERRIRTDATARNSELLSQVFGP